MPQTGKLRPTLLLWRNNPKSLISSVPPSHHAVFLSSFGFTLKVGDREQINQEDHKVTKNVNKPRHSHRGRCLTTHVKFMRDVVREACSFAPYQRPAMGLLKVSRDKHTLKFTKQRLETHIHGKRKREELFNILQPRVKQPSRRTEPSPL
ncbi:unnamed protein product [Nyctereutes procyonoides]|uniref:Large ribosomal subunit protein eL36 n=1 Tax=Nyctereutes procyonoides TaxID=34880 RepID=A0A811YVY2_NYCPR|nr:unnamed protein product [Nyctereutes procyonoides]CAD7688153.1 unnamed protein product [Nyctereutes procyonoides]